jgi:hypothetical protein
MFSAIHSTKSSKLGGAEQLKEAGKLRQSAWHCRFALYGTHPPKQCLSLGEEF